MPPVWYILAVLSLEVNTDIGNTVLWVFKNTSGIMQCVLCNLLLITCLRDFSMSAN